MTSHKLENYLRAYRKRSGLSQSEVAYLLGCKNGAQVSRYERRRHMPPLRTALAFQAALGTPLSELYAGTYESVSKQVAVRAQSLTVKLQTASPERGKSFIPYKLQWLAEHCIPQALRKN
jgi:transcriptional regulator with XRE-family HTH domain